MIARSARAPVSRSTEQPCEQESSQAESPADESCEKCADAEKASDEYACAEQEEEKELSPEERVETLEKENADLKDQLLRRAADFDNYRKRMIKEKQEAFDYANAALLQDLLESIDNLERTVAAAEGATDAKSIADGVKMKKNLKLRVFLYFGDLSTKLKAVAVKITHGSGGAERVQRLIKTFGFSHTRPLQKISVATISYGNGTAITSLLLLTGIPVTNTLI